MKILTTDDGKTLALFFEKGEGQELINIVKVALVGGKPLNKRSKAYAIAKQIDDELPIY